MTPPGPACVTESPSLTTPFFTDSVAEARPPWIKPEAQDILPAEQQKRQGMGVCRASAADLLPVQT